MPTDSEAETRALLAHQRETATHQPTVHGLETDDGARSRDEAEEEPVPERIGDYEILRELARGGMGVVYLARSMDLDRRVALKVLRGGDDHSRDGLERFQTEARVIARLRHPNIVGIHEVGNCGGKSFLVMDYIEGGSLRDRLQESGVLESREAAEIAEVVAEALAFAHERSILHRDVKPGNILLSTQGPILTDFGLAKDVSQVEQSPTLSGQPLGTPAYMAPEQARGDLERIDRRTDVYSLGVTLYEMLCGDPPFVGGSVYDLLDRLTRDPPPKLRKLRPEVDRDLETIVLTCLAKEPSRRYATARALAEDLRRYLEHQPIAARRPSPIERARLWLRRHSRVAQTAFVSLVALIIVAGAEARVFFDRIQQDHAEMEEALGVAKSERDLARGQLSELRTSTAALESASALGARARISARAGRWAEALDSYREAFRVAPKLVARFGLDAAEAAGYAAQAPGGEQERLLDEAARWLKSSVDSLPNRAEREAAWAAAFSRPGLKPWRTHPSLRPSKGL
ncbi:MAG: serine/threonine protein kinase [Planctomycetes bacterium]|nr:serine/threonine protein kinase [Planctomycetota bacterium]